MPVDLLVTGADLVATVDDERREIAGGWVAITDGMITAVGGPGDPPPPAATDPASRRLPGDARAW